MGQRRCFLQGRVQGTLRIRCKQQEARCRWLVGQRSKSRHVRKRAAPRTSSRLSRCWHTDESPVLMVSRQLAAEMKAPYCCTAVLWRFLSSCSFSALSTSGSCRDAVNSAKQCHAPDPLLLDPSPCLDPSCPARGPCANGPGCMTAARSCTHRAAFGCCRWSGL